MTEAGDARRWWLGALLAAGAVQLVALYAPSAGGAPPFPNADKLVHAAIFALPVLFGLLARLRPAVVVAVAALHAPVSELVQHFLLPHRDGDVRDVLADLVGVGLGWLLARLLVRLLAGRNGPAPLIS